LSTAATHNKLPLLSKLQAEVTTIRQGSDSLEDEINYVMTQNINDDNYVMSDKNSDSSSDENESDSEDEKKPKKKIPIWAQRPALEIALKTQRLDPDEIFQRVYSCNLDDIFIKKKKKFNKRTSSSEWTRDKVTMKEEIEYKRRMGYTSNL